MDNNTRLQKYWSKFEKRRIEITSYMNNTKWIKIFVELQRVDFLPTSQIKLLAEDNVKAFFFNTRFDENGICDGKNCPFLYKEIEWIFIPFVVEYERYNRNEKLNSRFKEVDRDCIITLINHLGNFETEVNEEGIKIFGYR